jgi:hypothetical protein
MAKCGRTGAKETSSGAFAIQVAQQTRFFTIDRIVPASSKICAGNKRR